MRKAAKTGTTDASASSAANWISVAIGGLILMFLLLALLLLSLHFVSYARAKDIL